ncbi:MULTISPECIES: hypothetical protein [Calothrix]|nr:MULTISPECIES: hypothetical protein [Calothrix]
MANYKFLTTWEIEAPITQVWDVINHSEQWTFVVMHPTGLTQIK